VPAAVGVKPVLGLAVLADTEPLVSICVQPMPVQVAGAVACGPNSKNVIVPPAFVPELEERVPVIAVFGIAVPAVPVAGPLTASVGLAFPTLIEVSDGQGLVAVLLLVSLL
jgi:hypothetical protein